MEKISELISYSVSDELVAKVAECIASLEEIQWREEEISKLQKEVVVVKTQVRIWEEDARAARKMVNTTCKAVDIVRATLSNPGEALVKARLFNKEVYRERNLSDS